jgi:hypothetical protein
MLERRRRVGRVEGLLGRRQGNVAVARGSRGRTLTLARDAAAVMIDMIVLGRPAAGGLLNHGVVHFLLETGAGPSQLQKTNTEVVSIGCSGVIFYCGTDRRRRYERRSRTSMRTSGGQAVR